MLLPAQLAKNLRTSSHSLLLLLLLVRLNGRLCLRPSAGRPRPKRRACVRLPHVGAVVM